MTTTTSVIVITALMLPILPSPISGPFFLLPYLCVQTSALLLFVPSCNNWFGTVGVLWNGLGLVSSSHPAPSPGKHILGAMNVWRN